MSAPTAPVDAGRPAGSRELYLLGISFCVLWSSAFIAAKFGLTAAPPLAQLTIRFLFAGALLVGLLYLMGKRWPDNKADVITGILLGVLNNSIYLGLFFYAMESSRTPSPISRAVNLGSPAISPQTQTGSRARRAAWTENSISRRTAGCSGL